MNEGYISHVEQANNLTIALHHSSAASKEHVNNMHYLDGIILLMGHIFGILNLFVNIVNLSKMNKTFCERTHM